MRKAFYKFSLATFVIVFGFCLYQAIQISGFDSHYFIGSTILLIFWCLCLSFKIQMNETTFNFLTYFVGFTGILLRLYWSFYVGVEQTSDAGFYINQGRKILETGLFIDPYKQVGPEVLSALGLGLFGSANDKSALVPYVIASCLFLPLCYLISKKIFGKTAAFFTLVLIAFWPEHIFYSSFVTAHIYQGCFLLLGVLFLIKAQEKNPRKDWIPIASAILSGIFFGLSQYMRGSSLLFFVSFLAAQIFCGFSLRQSLFVVLAFLLMLSPIEWFNYKNFGIFSLAPAQNSGVSFLIGANLETKGHYYEGFASEIQNKIDQMKATGELEALPQLPSGKSASVNQQWEINRAATVLALEKVRGHLLEFSNIAVFHKLPVFWASGASLSWALEGTYLGQDSVLRGKIERANDLFHQAFLGLCIFSLILLFLPKARFDFPNLHAFIWACLALGSVHMLAEIQSQYHAAVAGFYPIVAGAVFSNLKWIWRDGMTMLQGHFRGRFKNTHFFQQRQKP